MTPTFRLRAPHAPGLREDDVEGVVLDYLRLRGWFVRRQHVGRFRSPSGDWVTIGEKGDPDYFAIHRYWPGFAFETKRPGRQADPHQLAKHEELRRIWRVPVVVIDSLEALKEFLAEHERVAVMRWANAAPGCASRP